MKTHDSFIVLNTVDSTNNYAMESARLGRAKHGTAWFSSHQTNGKGSRVHNWLSEPGMNMAMSLVTGIDPVNVELETFTFAFP